MTDNKEEKVIIHQKVDKNIYKKIKMIAVSEGKRVADVVSDALSEYSTQQKIK